MDMKPMHAGNLKAAGYDERTRKLVVELTSGTFEYSGISSDIWRRLSGSGSPWSFFRDNVEEEFVAKRIR